MAKRIRHRRPVPQTPQTFVSLLARVQKDNFSVRKEMRKKLKSNILPEANDQPEISAFITLCTVFYLRDALEFEVVKPAPSPSPAKQLRIYFAGRAKALKKKKKK